MATLVLGSVLVYSVFLPQTAPKQITLAVLPLTENDEFTPLSVGLTAALRDSIALSRDIAVVDVVSTNSVIWDEQKRSGMSHILALTHFVDGQLQRENGKVSSLDIRLINVSQPNWKEVLVTNIPVGKDSLIPHQELRDDTTFRIRSALYDNSLMRTESSSYEPDEYLVYLEELGDWLLRFKDSNELSRLQGAFHTKLRELFTNNGIATEPNQLLWEAVQAYKRSLNSHQYADSVLQLAGEYPNSIAVTALAQLAYDVGELDLAEHAALRAARVQPQSAELALYIGFFRHLLGDSEGVEKAFRIAQLRDEVNVVPYFAEVAESFSSSSKLPVTSTADLQRYASSHVGRFADDFTVTALIHLGILNSIDPSELTTDRFWTAPPIWMNHDDRRWLESRAFLQRHYDFVLDEVPAGLLREAATEEAIQTLFAPRRPD